MRYLCHLWPVRAVERISLRPPYETDLSEHLLVLLNKKDYWTYFTVLESTARQLWPGAHVVGGLQYGVSSFSWFCWTTLKAPIRANDTLDRNTPASGTMTSAALTSSTGSSVVAR